MSSKMRFCDLRAGHIVDFATLPGMEKYAWAWGQVEWPEDDQVNLFFEHWGEYDADQNLPGGNRQHEVEVLTTEEQEAKIKALDKVLDAYPCDGWSDVPEHRHPHSPTTLQIMRWPEYGDPGTEQPQRGILLANWNHVSQKVQDWLEEIGFSLEWEDEWTEIDGKVYRSSPNSYHWTPNWVMDEEGNTYTIQEHDGMIEALAMTGKGHTPYLLPDWVTDAELQEEGFVKADAEERESGFFPGQNDTPEKDAVPLFEKGAEAVIFRRTEQSQFYGKWDVWVRWPEPEPEPTYSIIRHRFKGGKSVIKTGLTLEEAQAYCEREDTHGDGWFDGYTKE